jgi:hypothetical protein
MYFILFQSLSNPYMSSEETFSKKDPLLNPLLKSFPSPLDFWPSQVCSNPSNSCTLNMYCIDE